MCVTCAIVLGSETQALPLVQLFDKTMAVKQMHILEPQDLLITRADKGRLIRFDSLFIPSTDGLLCQFAGGIWVKGRAV